MLPIRVLLFLTLAPLAANAQTRPEASRVLSIGPVELQVLIDSHNAPDVGLEVGEILLPSGLRGRSHTHSTFEAFYVLSGELHHTVNGQLQVVGPGEVGIALAGDSVGHAVPGDVDVRAIAFWTPGGALQELIDKFGFSEKDSDHE